MTGRVRYSVICENRVIGHSELEMSSGAATMVLDRLLPTPAVAVYEAELRLYSTTGDPQLHLVIPPADGRALELAHVQVLWPGGAHGLSHLSVYARMAPGTPDAEPHDEEDA